MCKKCTKLQFRCNFIDKMTDVYYNKRKDIVKFCKPD